MMILIKNGRFFLCCCGGILITSILAVCQPLASSLARRVSGFIHKFLSREFSLSPVSAFHQCSQLTTHNFQLEPTRGNESIEKSRILWPIIFQFVATSIWSRNDARKESSALFFTMSKPGNERMSYIGILNHPLPRFRLLRVKRSECDLVYEAFHPNEPSSSKFELIQLSGRI